MSMNIASWKNFECVSSYVKSNNLLIDSTASSLWRRITFKFRYIFLFTYVRFTFISWLWYCCRKLFLVVSYCNSFCFLSFLKKSNTHCRLVLMLERMMMLWLRVFFKYIIACCHFIRMIRVSEFCESFVWYSKFKFHPNSCINSKL